MLEKLSNIYDKSTSSVINTKFATLQEEFKRETHSVFQLGNPDKRSLSTVISKIRKENGEITDHIAKLKSGVLITNTNPRTGKVETICYKVYELQELWNNGDFRLPDWRTLLDFLMAYQEAYLEVADKVRAKQDRERTIQSPSTLEVYGETGNYVMSKPAPLIGRFIQVYKRKPTDIDNSFLYNHLRKDTDGTLYWIRPKEQQVNEDDNNTNNDPYVLVDEKDSAFWSAFWQTNEEKIANYLNAIPSLLCKLRDERTDEEGLPKQSVEDVLLAHFPVSFLAILDLQTVYTVCIDCTKEKDNKTYSFCRYDVGTWVSKDKGMLCDTQSIRNALSSQLFKGAYFNKSFVKEFRQVSNVEGTAFAYIDLKGIDTTGRDGKNRALQHLGAPELPKQWHIFLHGVDGNTPIFPTDARMCELRLAFFVACLADTSIPTIRQALYVFGDGECGKTTLLETIKRVIGENAVGALKGSPKDWYDSYTFGLRNKALAYVAEVEDPEAVFNDSMFKSITGGSAIQLRKLYNMAGDYTPEHLLFAMSVNGSMRIKEDFVASRMIPIGMTKNYVYGGQRAKEDIYRDLLSERKEFLQWCFDTKAYYENQTRGDGSQFSMTTPSGVFILTDAQFDEMLKSTDTLTAEQVSALRGAAIQNIGQIPNCATRHLTVYSQSEITKGIEECRRLLIDKLFVFDQTAVLRNIELNFALKEALLDTSDKELSFLLCEMGFKVSRDQSVLRGPAFRDLRMALVNFGAKAEIVKKERVLVGVRLRKKDEKKMLHLGGFEEEV